MTDNLAAFRELVRRNPDLRGPLRDTADAHFFCQEVVRLGREHGFRFTLEEVEQALRDERRAWLERWLV